MAKELPDPWELWQQVTKTERRVAKKLGMDSSSYPDVLGLVGEEVNPLTGGTPIAASKGEFKTFEAIFYGDDDGGPTESALAYYDPTEVRMAARTGDKYTPAPITVVPTSSSNFKRPRTVAAGYDNGPDRMTVIFRDGTWWNYYDVPGPLWSSFKQAYSKGKFLERNGFNAGRFQMGPANVAQMPTAGRELLYRITRTHQIMSKGYQANHSVSRRRPARATKKRR